MLGHLEEAKRNLEKASRIEPQDTAIGRELHSVDQELLKQRRNEQELCKRMFPGARQNQAEIEEDFDEVDDGIYEELQEQIQGKQ